MMVLVPESSSGGLEAASDFIIALQSLIDSRWIPMSCDIILEIPSEVVYKSLASSHFSSSGFFDLLSSTLHLKHTS